MPPKRKSSAKRSAGKPAARKTSRNAGGATAHQSKAQENLLTSVEASGSQTEPLFRASAVVEDRDVYDPWEVENEDGGGRREEPNRPELVVAEESEARASQSVVENVGAESRLQDDVVETDGGGSGQGAVVKERQVGERDESNMSVQHEERQLVHHRQDLPSSQERLSQPRATEHIEGPLFWGADALLDPSTEQRQCPVATASPSMSERLDCLQAQIDRQEQECREVSRKMWDKIGAESRRVSEMAVMIDNLVEAQTAMLVVEENMFQDKDAAEEQPSGARGQPTLSGEGRQKQFIELTAPVSSELRQRMGMVENQPLPDFVPEGERPLVDDRPALRIDWDLPWNSRENQDIVSNIIDDITTQNDRYSQLVVKTGKHNVVKHCLDSIHNLYYRQAQEQKGNMEERQAKGRRSERRRKKTTKRNDKLRLPSNADLANRYGHMKWNIPAATSEDETDNEQGTGEGTAIGSGGQSKGTLILPAWRSLQLEEIIRETDRRRQNRLRAVPTQAVRHPGEARLPAPGESPPPVPSNVYRWMVSRLFAQRFPDAIRMVRSNLLTERTPNSLDWGDPPPYVVREPNAGARSRSAGAQGRGVVVASEEVAGAARATAPRIGEGSASMPQEAALGEVGGEIGNLDPRVLRESTEYEQR